MTPLARIILTMMNKIISIIIYMKTRLLIAPVIVMLTGLPACSTDDDATKIKNTLAEIQQTVEARLPREFVSHLAEGFEDQKGRDAQALRGFLAGLFLRNTTIHVFLKNVEVQLNGGSVTSRCLVTVTGGQGIIPERMRRLLLLLEWKKESGDWKVYRANWREPEDVG